MQQFIVRSQVRSAFTLIELLVVVAIIALLISILLPSLSRAREQAKAVKCRANLHQMGLCLTMYLDEHRGCFPGEHTVVLRCVALSPLGRPTAFGIDYVGLQRK